jgi:DNA-binding transcriptional LysR family regulator
MPELQLVSLDERRFLRNVDWNLLHLFYDIVHSGGISAAARRLNRQQPTISAALKRLEDHLGVELFRRTGHGVELTAAGRALLPLCESMVKAVRAVPHEIAKAADLVEGKIHIRTISSVVSTEFDEALAVFHRSHPGVEIHLDVAPWREVVRSVDNGEVQVGIACDSAPSAALNYAPLTKEVQQLYCSRDHRLYGTSVRDPSALVDETFILTGQDEPEELERFRRRFGLGLRVGGFAENLHEVRRLIELGVGIGFMPTCVADMPSCDMPRRALWPLLRDELLPAYHVHLITGKQSDRSTPTELFLQEILPRLQQ